MLRAVAACPVQAISDGRLSPPRRAAVRPPGRRCQVGRRAQRIVIVGASLAGLWGAATLRKEGFDGVLTIIGDENEPPYDRPPLTKQVLTGWVAPDHTVLPHLEPLGDTRWLLGTPAAQLDRRAGEVVLADGTRVPYDLVLIATGVRNRPWPASDQAALSGVCGVRTRQDAARLIGHLEAGARRVVVIGAGFTGSEVASACRHRGIDVTVVEQAQAPLTGALGGVIGDVAANLHAAAGVDLPVRSHGAGTRGKRREVPVRHAVGRHERGRRRRGRGPRRRSATPSGWLTRAWRPARSASRPTRAAGPWR